MLLHFDEAQRIKVLRMFHQALQPDGILAMEHTQKLPRSLDPLFRPVAANAQVYRKVERFLVGHAPSAPVPSHVRDCSPEPGTPREEGEVRVFASSADYREKPTA